MEGFRNSKRFGELVKGAVVVAAAALLFQFHLLFFLFLIPLYLYGQERPAVQVLLADGLVWLILLVQGLLITSKIGDIGVDRAKLLLMDLSFPTALILGHAAFFLLKGSSFSRLLKITAGAGLAGLPLIVIVASDGAIARLLKEQIVLVTEMLRRPLGDAENWEASVLFAELTPEVMVETTKNLFFRFFLAAYFLMEALALLLARGVRGRFFGGKRVRFTTFFLAEGAIWFLLGSAAVIGADVILDLGPVAYPFWNAGAIMVLAYAVQGLGIVGYRMEKSPRLWRARFSLMFLYIILLFTPVVNIIAFFSVPVLGVSEVWIRYRDA